MTISAKIIADSIWHTRITTMEVRYPRMIHAEELTHRLLRTTPETLFELHIPDGLMYDENLSRNASSSRAIPVSRVIQDVLDDPAIPVSWGKNQKGMQAGAEHDALVKFRHDEVSPERAWLRARDQMVDVAKAFSKAGYHKQVVNRLLEPWAHITVVVTATEWDNFFGLRCHPDADPTIQALACAMRDARNASTPIRQDWHLPYVSDGRLINCLVSAARCARTSYKTHDGRDTEENEDVALARSLAESGHWSPFEHQARVREGRHANFNGWISQRTEIGQ